MKIKDISGFTLEREFAHNKGHRTEIECECGKGVLVVREAKTKFFGCSCYPNCKNMYGIAKRENPMAYMHHISSIASSVDRDMRRDREYSGESRYDFDYDEQYSWGTNGGVYCHDDM